MKSLFQAFAEYNRKVNGELTALLGGLTEEQLSGETNSYYHSIYSTFVHVMFSDIAWLKRFQEAYPAYISFPEGGVLPPDEMGFEKELEGDYRKAFELRARIDDALEQFIKRVPEESLGAGFKYRNNKGVEIERILWKALLQIFNHQTHHRGSIAALLDIQGVGKDYSTLLTRIR